MFRQILFLFLAGIFLIAFQNNLVAQNAPVTTCGNVSNAVPGTITVPITVNNFANIGAISLTLDYDCSIIQFVQGTPHPQLATFAVGDNDLGTGYHRIIMGWYGQGTTLTDGSTIMTLSFTYVNGITALIWYDNGPSCEYADADYNVLNDIPTSTYYINGLVCGAIGNPGTINGNNEVCAGQSGEEYSVAPVENATGYVWEVQDGVVIITGQNTNAVTVDFLNYAVSGDISVYGYNDCGNGPVSALAVTVNELPIADAGEDITINYGTSTTLNAAPGGTGVYAYQWSPEELLIDPDVQNPQTIILTTTTIFSLTVTNQNTFCQNSDEVTVTITGGPLSVSPVAIPESVCQGESSQLYSNAGGGSENYTYQWTCDPPGNPPWSSNQANPVVSPDSSRHYLLTVSDGFSIVYGSTDLVVLQLPTATITGGDTLCGYGTLTTLNVDLTGTPPWNFIYSYGITSVYVYGQYTSPYSITTGEPGNYIVSFVEDANCTGNSYGSAAVYVFNIPATPEITVIDNELISSACCGNQWYFNDVAIPGATNQTFVATESGLYYDIVTLNGCSSEPSEVVDIIVSIDETNAGTLSFYPNPAKTQVTIQTAQPITGSLKVSLCSSYGIAIRTYYFKDEESIFNIDISGLAPGLYFLIFSSGDIHSAGRLIIH